MIVDPSTAPRSEDSGLQTLHLSVAGGLTQFGAFTETLMPGARLAEDDVTYPDIDLHHSRRNGLRMQSRKDGTPYPGWPKETNR